MNVLIIGSDGFIAKNLIIRLNYLNFKICYFNKENNDLELKRKILNSNIIFYLAGINKVKKNSEYKENIKLTKKITDILKNTEKKIKIIFSSSIQVKKNNPYGLSKLNCEKLLLKLKIKKNINLIIYRLPNIFGKWSRPFYNSVVSTFCYQLSRKKKITINFNEKIELLYIDDLIDDFIELIKNKKFKLYKKANKSFKITVIKLANILKSFKNLVANIDFEFNEKKIKDLYSTYLSYIPDKNIYSKIKLHKDDRGNFMEIFKHKTSGQISFFTIKPKKIRGNHFHNTKTEKFLLVSGKAKINYINLSNNKKYSITLTEKVPKIVVSKPGDAHNIVNIGFKDAKFLLWSNEIFDTKQPDTYKYDL